MDLQAVLTSTVVAAVISILANVYNARRAESLKYVTEERQKWREEIRKIAEDIVDCPRDEIKKYLTKLKVRINAYGNLRKESYYEDAHIWKVIEKLEDVDNNNQEFEKKKERLVYFLSLMLKYDWERQKREVAGSKISSIKLLLSTIIIIIVLTSSRSIEAKQIVTCAFIVAPNLSVFTHEIILKLYITKKEKKFSVGLIVSMFILLAILAVGVVEICSIMKEEELFTRISTIVLHILNVILAGIDIVLYVKEKSDYEGTIENIISQ